MASEVGVPHYSVTADHVFLTHTPRQSLTTVQTPLFPVKHFVPVPLPPSSCLGLQHSPGSLAAGKGQVGDEEDSAGERGDTAVGQPALGLLLTP